MKKYIALLLVLMMLLSMVACNKDTSDKEDMVTLYVVTEQKNYEKNELVSTASFAYDDHGRPVLAGFEKADGSGRKSEITYDKRGNLLQEVLTQTFADGSVSVRQFDWNLTYEGRLLTVADRLFENESNYVLKFTYDEDDRLVLVEYPAPEEGMGGYLWQSYEYDEEGKLVQETRCTSQYNWGGNYSYTFSRVCYEYDKRDRLVEQYYCSARSDLCNAPEDMKTLNFQISPLEHYFFYYDEEGNLAYIGDGEDDTYPGGKADIYSDENCTFDENGNLVRVQRDGNSWVEYTYEAIEINASDLVMHKRLLHGISNFTLSYTIYNTMDPLFWEMLPPAEYHYHLCSMMFYYLIPYPQFELLIEK